MEVAQVVQLAVWFQKHVKVIAPQFSSLVEILQNNSQQPSQMPVAQPLKNLTKALADMPTSELSTLQLRVLDELDVAKLIGKRGKIWINKRVRATTYDPATTYQSIYEAQQKLEFAKTYLNEFKAAANKLGFLDDESIDAPTPYVFNVIFQKDAGIKNVRDWKKAAADWELIILGVTAVVNEKPEDVTVVGAQNGSIIFTLSATPIVTRILAAISNHIAIIANNYLDFQIKREALRQSRMMSDVIERDLKRQETELIASGKSNIMEHIKQITPDASPESLGKLEKAIDKEITFYENGGEIDFVLPPAIDDSEDEDLVSTVNELRQFIQEYRQQHQKTKLLTHVEDDDVEEEDEDN